ncbi:MAG: hypothetical protein M1586_02890 [Patescibacteria group bacterium]|nr:hypothetical protein [Patescibacteria group bacterium]MCL5262210.1 hypothetical protein [Patescibacteria group bacterium]
MKTKLSHVLLDLGFFSALGTSEHPAMTPKEIYVKRGEPNTIDRNNGLIAVYDEVGRPWILHNSRFTDEVEDKLREYPLKPGAYVPHSNDCGQYVHEVVLKS